MKKKFILNLICDTNTRGNTCSRTKPERVMFNTLLVRSNHFKQFRKSLVDLNNSRLVTHCSSANIEILFRTKRSIVRRYVESSENHEFYAH